MICQWEPLQSVLPESVRADMKEVNRENLLEIRLRQDKHIEWICDYGHFYSDHQIDQKDLHYLVNAASRYSPWASESIARGFLSIAGGHRIGVCGETTCNFQIIKGFREIHSACIRVARDICGIAEPHYIGCKSLLIIGAPGWGKTTMLRDYARQLARRYTTTVIDERGELFPKGFLQGDRMDIYTGCPKKEGIEFAQRTMSPDVIVLDEITAEEESIMLAETANCGVEIVATAHATSFEDLRRRPAYKILLDYRVFSHILVLRRDRSCTVERVNP